MIFRTLVAVMIGIVIGWVAGVGSDAYSCDRIGAFYYGLYVYSCEQKS